MKTKPAGARRRRRRPRAAKARASVSSATSAASTTGRSTNPRWKGSSARRTNWGSRVAPSSRVRRAITSRTSSLAREGFDLTIGVGPGRGAQHAAKRYTDSNFAIIDYSVNAPPFAKNPNVQGLTFATNENSYMIGCLAALMAQKQGGKQVISAVGGIKLSDGGHLHRGLPGGQAVCRGPGPDRLLAGLRRAGQVQGDRAQPDRARARRSSSRWPAAAVSARSTRAGR